MGRLNIRRIQNEVEKLLRQNTILRPPVKVQAIAKNLGITIRYEPFEDDISGVLYRDKDNTIIGVSSFHHPNRQRFTIAHEIGHLILHEMDVHVDKGFRMVLRDLTSSHAIDPLEIEANRFAAGLLMPEKMLREDVKKYLRDCENEIELERLARQYQVSTQALAFRLANIGLFT